MAITFVLGIFYTWYVVGQLGLAGLGLLALAIGSFGIRAIDSSLRQSIVRELATSLATGDQKTIRQTIASALGCSIIGAGIMLLFYGAIAGIAYAGLFNTPVGEPRFPLVLAVLFLSEGLAVAIRLVLGPLTQSVFASRLVMVDNLFAILQRLVFVIALVLACSVFWPDADIATKLFGTVVVRLVLLVIEQIFELIVAFRLVPKLSLDPRAGSVAEMKTVGTQAWHTTQMQLLGSVTPQFLQIVINLMFGLTYNGIWQIVVQIGGHALMVSEGALRGIDPVSTHLQQKGAHASILNLMVRGLRYQLLAVLPFALSYLIFMRPLLDLWVGGRLAKDEALAEAMTVDQALWLATFMASLGMIAEVIKASTRGLERMMYGLGEVRSYAWFAKWAALISVGGASLLMFWTQTPKWAPLPMLVANAGFSAVILLSARKNAGLSLRRAAKMALPRPLIASLVFAVLLVLARLWMPPLDLTWLLVLAAGIGLTFALVSFTIGLQADERARFREFGRGLRRRLG